MDLGNVNASPIDASRLNFTHGVASGDPYPDSVILWTRVAPVQDNDRSNITVSGFAPLYNHDTDTYIKSSQSPVSVDWSISQSADLSSPVASGTAYTSSDIDYTLKVEAKGLQTYTQYYYQFSVSGAASNKSPVGRTKTTPAPNDSVSSVGIAVYSCSNFPFGFFVCTESQSLKLSRSLTFARTHSAILHAKTLWTMLST